MELENAKGREHKSIFTVRMAFSERFQIVFYHRAERYSVHKRKVY